MCGPWACTAPVGTLITVIGRRATRRIHVSRLVVTCLLVGLLAALAPQHAMADVTGTTTTTTPPPPPQMVDVIVQQWNGADATAANLVAQLGGQVTRQLPVVLGFAAHVPLDAVSQLAASPAIRMVSPDNLVLPQALDAPTTTTTTSTTTSRPSVYRDAVGATAAAARGFTGAGATVAIIDTGVSQVPALAGRVRTVVDAAGNTTGCVNLSSETTCHDNYGHGTFVAGMVNGVAPDAQLLAVKLSGRDGKSNVSTVLAAIGWVIANRDLYDIDVVNLSLRTDSTLSYRLDPLNLAVERAWARGITVVISAGNQGPTARTIAKPADDPWVLSVGAVDDSATAAVGDDVPADFSSRGPTLADGLAKPDVAAPGKSLISLRSPGSAADADFPFFVDDYYRRGSGTSFSSPIVAGAAAVFLQAHPEATNDRVKFALAQTAKPVTGATADAVGRGVVDVNAAIDAPAGLANQGLFQPLLYATGMPSPVDAIGLVSNGVSLQDVATQGANWQGANWQGANWQGANWQGANWQGANWQGSNWQGSNWQGANWQGANWQGANWQGANWQGANWQAGYWS
jgi:serine protease AprX